jgi:hypothetical protein
MLTKSTFSLSRPAASSEAASRKKTSGRCHRVATWLWQYNERLRDAAIHDGSTTNGCVMLQSTIGCGSTTNGCVMLQSTI